MNHQSFRILLLCPHFEPDLHAATGEVMSRLVHALADRGHQIDVVTALPWYRAHDVEQGWRGRPWRVEKTEWGRIVRVWPFPTDKNKISARALGFAGFTSLVAAASVVGRRRPDVVIAMSPPIFLADAGRLAAARWRVPLVFNTQDIFPDIAVEIGALTNERVIAAASRHERTIYRRSDAITVLSADQSGNVRSKLPSDQQDKVHIIHNFVDLDRIVVADRDNEYRRQHDLGDKFVIMYSGNVGLSQPFELIRHAAEQWRHRSDVQFVINGEGAARPDVDGWADDLDNVTVADFAPRDRVSEVLGAADLQLILLRTGLAKSSTPSKLYANLAAGRPVLASIDVGSEVANSLEAAGAGVSVPPEDPAAFMTALEKMVADPGELRAMGQRARTYVEQWMTPGHQAESYEKLITELVHRPTATRS